MVRSVVVVTVALVVGACGAGNAEKGEAQASVEALKHRAASDFSCPEGQVKTNTLDPRTKVAEGCGHKATYIRVCHKCPDTSSLSSKDFEDCDCTWTLDSVQTPR
jgi:hypothetical protein